MSMNKNGFRWFGYVERVSDERMLEKICDAKFSGKRGKWRPLKTSENTILMIRRREIGKLLRNQDSLESIYEDVNDSGRVERGM